jgi:YesN/AraC family two-component response regulator
MRIEDAKKIMLENPQMNILSISQMTGYTEQANFSRQFKLIAGMSPLLWKKKHFDSAIA